MNEIEARQLAARFLDGARKCAEDSPPRHRPSPSSISRCTRQSWYSETGAPPTETPDGESWISAESGRESEKSLCRALNASGIARVDPLTEEERELQPFQLKRMNIRGGQIDQLGFVGRARQKDADGEWEDDGDLVLVEFKRKGVYDMLDLWRSLSVREKQPGEYDQMQTLMEALQLDRALYIAANWDRGQLTSHGPGGFEWRFKSKWKAGPATEELERGTERYPGAYLEWVPKNALTIRQLKARAAMQVQFIVNEKIAARVPKDYDPFLGKFPCTWCAWFRQCKIDSGGQA